MDKNPLFSIVIPTYNHADFLKASLSSIIDQSYNNWEAIVIDNHSRDNTDDVVASFEDSRIRLEKINNHGVIATSRNRGILKAKGEWISFLDSDDLWYSEKLMRVVSAIKESDNQIQVFCNDEYMVFSDSSEKKLLQYGPYEDNFYSKLLLSGNRLSTSAVTVNKSFLTNKELLFSENPSFVTVEDYDFWLRIAKEQANFFFINEVLGEYTIHGKNQSASIEKHFKHHENLIKHHIFNIQNFDSCKEKLWKKAKSKIQLDKALLYLKEFKLRLAAIGFFCSFWFAPSHFLNQLMHRFRKKISS